MNNIEKKEIKMYDGDCLASYEETPEKRQLVWDKVIAFCKEHNASTGESTQNDNFVLEAPQLIATIIDDIISFETKWIDEQ